MVAVTDAVVSPVIPASTPQRRRDQPAGTGPQPVRRALPLAEVPAPRTVTVVYGLACVDRRGRVADRTVLCALGWSAGQRLDIRERGGLLVVHAEAHGVFCMTAQGYLRLPAAARRWCGLVTGDRVLLAADPARGRLVVHPPTALDAMVATWHAQLLDGDPA